MRGCCEHTRPHRGPFVIQLVLGPPPSVVSEMSEGGGLSTSDTVNVVVAIILLTLSGLFSGLNLGLMSFTDDDLGVIIEGSDNPKEVLYAKRIRPLRKRGNLLLCTLLLGCTLVNAIIAILLADLTGGTVGTILTTCAGH
jgi:metal transporter CNNM